ncbi:DUF2140 family protein [Terrisporobacter sp.]
MKNKKRLLFVIVFILIGLFFVGEHQWKQVNNKDNKIGMNIGTDVNLPRNQIEYIKSLVGLESKNMKILDNPLRVEGSFYIPEKTILSYINYYLKNSKNKDIENVQVTINKNGLTLKGQYKILAGFKTPIDIDILPTLTSNGDLKLELKDIRVLNFSLGGNIVDAIVKSWFSDLNNIKVEKGSIIIDKSFLKNASIKGIEVKEDYLVIDLSVKLEE